MGPFRALDKEPHPRRRIRQAAHVKRSELIRKIDARGYANEAPGRLALLFRRGATLAFFHDDLAFRRTRYPRAYLFDIPGPGEGSLRPMNLAASELQKSELRKFPTSARPFWSPGTVRSGKPSRMKVHFPSATGTSTPSAASADPKKFW
ncbi:MAG: hypothetical protein CL933_00425 [Deltaproteobacteria bacterium]|nr:hypothetical protein [Deltaproteobacteria bacterium]